MRSHIFAVHAPGWRAAGWAGTLPLPAGRKWPPPEGFTGAEGRDPTHDEVRAWAEANSDGNYAVRVPSGVAGLDVDAYKPDGAESWQELQATCGALPDTWILTSREPPSGIRLFRVLPGIRLRGAPRPGIEVIQHHHRYVVGNGCRHPDGMTYRLVAPGGEIAEHPPSPHDLPMLPKRWLIELIEPVRATGTPPERRHAGDWSLSVTKAFANATAGMVKGSRHDTATSSALTLARYEHLDHPGATEALDALGSVFTVSIALDRATPKQAADEWDDIVVSARSLVASTASTAPRWEERRTGDPSTNGHASSDGSDPYEDVPPPTDDDAPTVKRAPGRPAVATELVALAESRYRFAQADDGRPFAVPLDGSFSQDCTALVAVTVDHPRHVDVVELWEPPIGGTEYRVPVADVEEAIREACRRWTVREIVADPFRWTRSLQALEAEGLPVVEFPQSPARMTPATTRLFEAVVNDRVTHSGDLRLARHVGNCTLREDSRGTRLAKTSKHSTRRIDLAVAAVMAHDRASRVEPPKPKRVPLIAWL